MLHYVKDDDFPPDYKVVYDQNGWEVYYVRTIKEWLYAGSSNVAEVECWKEIE